MSSRNVFCFQCACQQQGRRSTNGEYACASCNSDFCEVVVDHQHAPQEPIRSSFDSFNRDAGATVIVPPVPASHTGSGRHAQFMIIHETIDLSDVAGGLLPPGNQVGEHAGIQMGDFATQESLDAILTRLLQAYQPPSQPSSQAVLDALPRLPVPPPGQGGSTGTSSQPAAKNDDAEHPSIPQFACCRPGEPCTVCHENFKESEQVLQMPCMHCFHEECILPWLKEHNTCPVCRHKLDVEAAPQQQHQQGLPENPNATPTRPELRQQQQLHRQLLQNFDALGRQLQDARSNAQAQLNQIMQSDGSAVGAGASDTPLAQLSDQLAALQRSWEAARHDLNAFEAQMMTARLQPRTQRQPPLEGLQLQQQIRRVRQVHASPDARLAPELALLGQEVEQLREQHVVRQQGYRGLPSARAEMLGHVYQEGHAAREQLLQRVSEGRAPGGQDRRPTPAAPTSGGATRSNGLPGPAPEARLPATVAGPQGTRLVPHPVRGTSATAALAPDREIERRVRGTVSRSAGARLGIRRMSSQAAPTPAQVTNARGDVVHAGQGPAPAAATFVLALEGGSRGMPTAQASNLQRNALAEISHILQQHHEQLQGLAGGSSQQRRQGRGQLDHLPATNPRFVLTSWDLAPLPFEGLLQPLEVEEVQRRQSVAAAEAINAAAAGEQLSATAASGQAEASTSPSSAPDANFKVAQGTATPAETPNRMVPPSLGRGENLLMMMGLPMALMAGAMILAGKCRRWLARRG